MSSETDGVYTIQFSTPDMPQKFLNEMRSLLAAGNESEMRHRVAEWVKLNLVPMTKRVG